MNDPFDVLVTYVDGVLVYADTGEPVPAYQPPRVCENTLFLREAGR